MIINMFCIATAMRIGSRIMVEAGANAAGHQQAGNTYNERILRTANRKSGEHGKTGKTVSSLYFFPGTDKKIFGHPLTEVLSAKRVVRSRSMGEISAQKSGLSAAFLFPILI